MVRVRIRVKVSYRIREQFFSRAIVLEPLSLSKYISGEQVAMFSKQIVNAFPDSKCY